jgi:hypothetical protein
MRMKNHDGWCRLGKNSQFVHHSTLWWSYQESHLVANRIWSKKMMDFLSMKYSSIPIQFFHMLQNLTTWGLRLYFHSKGRCAVDFIALKNSSLQPGLNQRTLGQMASTLTITPLRQLSITVTGWYWAGCPKHCNYFWFIVHPQFEFWSFLIHPPELSGNNQQRSCSKAGKTWWDMVVNFTYKITLFIPVGFFNML